MGIKLQSNWLLLLLDSCWNQWFGDTIENDENDENDNCLYGEKLLQKQTSNVSKTATTDVRAHQYQ